MEAGRLGKPRARSALHQRLLNLHSAYIPSQNEVETTCRSDHPLHGGVEDVLPLRDKNGQGMSPKKKNKKAITCP